jgi:hypothetical protein
MLRARWGVFVFTACFVLVSCDKVDELIGGLTGADEKAEPAAEAPKPAAEVSKPAAEVPKPVAEVPKPVAEAPEPVAEAPKPKEHARQEFVKTFAAVECALAVLDDAAAREVKKAGVLKANDYTAEAYVADIQKYGTMEAEAAKAACMPKQGKTAKEFAAIFAEMACAFARAEEESEYEGIADEILARHDYDAEAFSEDQIKHGTEQGEALAAACMPEPRGQTREGLVELSIKLACADRSGMSEEERADYREILFDEYGVDEDGYKAGRDKVRKDADFNKAVRDGMAKCPAKDDLKKKAVAKTKAKHKHKGHKVKSVGSPLAGRYNARISGGGLTGQALLVIKGRKVSHATVRVRGKSFTVKKRSMTGNRVYLEASSGADSLRLTGTLKGGGVRGRYSGTVGGKNVTGVFSGTK